LQQSLLKSIGADLTRETQTGFSYCAVRIAVPPESVDLLQNPRLVPGMPVEVFVKGAGSDDAGLSGEAAGSQLQRSFRDP